MVERDPTPVDSDIDLHVPAERAELRPSPVPVLAAISAGGVCGTLARYGLSTAWPHPRGGFPWATLVINVSGCLLIGVLMVIVTEVATERRLLRPFVGVGVLGGYTTFSTYVMDIHQTAGAGAPWAALAYLAVTVVGALLAVWAGAAATGAVVSRWAGRASERAIAKAGAAR
ncbi:CrcB family protein [Dactylosporangium sp. NPDC051484]|uniref:fluoride efflux transporter FluC n=1 Tax=Dactylosporangium sp. NPDC051484 TaxID=3154942 RepID=UPI00344CC0AE